jgi:DNA (cytosine-5)-methyltransferase 1
MITLVDLCAGTGAFSRAFHDTGRVETIYANDMLESSRLAYDLNNAQKLTCADITTVDCESVPKSRILTAGFPCFIAGTRVLTNSGYKSIEDVVITDELMTHTGDFQQIINLQSKEYSGELYNIRAGGNLIVCTPEHPIYARDNSGEISWIPARELANHRVGMIVANKSIMPAFKDAKNKNIWFILGCYMRTGHCALLSGINYSLNATHIPQWIQNAPIKYVRAFILGYNNYDNEVCAEVRLGFQRLLMKSVGADTWFDCEITRTQANNVMVYNFEVDVDNSYVVENICVHNCQNYSIAGLQKGFADKRSNVFWKIIDILEQNAPEIVLLENVKNLQAHDGGNSFKVIIASLEKLGYHIKHTVLNTSKITGIPQNRERIYIACFKDSAICDVFNFDFAEVAKRPITDFLEDIIPDKYYYTEKSPIYAELAKSIDKHISSNTVYQYRRKYVRENKSAVCPTLTANMGTGGHNVPIILDNGGIRKLTPRECFNLQGFGDYVLPDICASKLYSLAGNAVSVPVIALIAKKIVELL